jgi:spoIIIJ-associated protein
MSAGTQVDPQLVAQSQQWLQDLLAKTGLAVTVTPGGLPGFEQLEGVWLTLGGDITAAQVQLLLADNGQPLDAIQYLLNVHLNLGKDKEHHTAFNVELAGHRHQRLQALQAMADQVAEQVRSSQTEVEMPPLSSAERRLVHTLFKDVPDLATVSRGQEPDRRLVVQLRTENVPEH